MISDNNDDGAGRRPLPRLNRLVQTKKLTEGRRLRENPTFNSEIYGPGVSWLAEPEHVPQVPAPPAPWTTVWPRPTEMQAFVAQWMSDDGWDVRKPKVRRLLRSTVPAEEGDDGTFPERAVEYIQTILAQMVPQIPKKPRTRVDQTSEQRRIDNNRAAGRARTGWMGANRFASDVDRHEAPRGDRSARLHTQQAPRCFCACMMLQV